MSPVTLTIDPHPLLELRWLLLDWSRPLGTLAAGPELHALLDRAAAAPLAPDDTVRHAVRDMLRSRQFRPTGRSKPASEYLAGAAETGRLSRIDIAVDLGNAVSLHSGLPISVVDVERLTPPLRVALAETGARYEFNTAGQVIDVAGLPCLHDAAGPCANAVKDARRSKTGADTRRTLVLIWGTRALPGRTEQTHDWLATLARTAGATIAGRG
jgi:DNA/RNA-binding domain of Phe-tRNA-synthetase-like protein